MKYPYQHIRRGGAIRFLPLIPVTLHGPDGVADVLSLVDSGAEQNVFRSDVAEEIGLNPKDNQLVTLLDYNGEEAPGFRILVDLQLGRRRWQAPIIFSDTVARRGVLGQAGFFVFFNVHFKHSEQIMEIRPVKHRK